MHKRSRECCPERRKGNTSYRFTEAHTTERQEPAAKRKFRPLRRVYSDGSEGGASAAFRSAISFLSSASCPWMPSRREIIASVSSKLGSLGIAGANLLIVSTNGSGITSKSFASCSGRSSPWTRSKTAPAEMNGMKDFWSFWGIASSPIAKDAIDGTFSSTVAFSSCSFDCASSSDVGSPTDVPTSTVVFSSCSFACASSKDVGSPADAPTFCAVSWSCSSI
mmetsp:Transcript_49907/g.139710  ORF Transcript_49907/g.139710 Transcript_49907/m.139710 type:complete len:222 (+) Transcript_49907:91-756(+)